MLFWTVLSIIIAWWQNDELRLFDAELSDEEVLLRNLASVHIQQKAYSDPGHRQLHCLVLKTPRILSHSQSPDFGAAFFMRAV